MFPAKTRILIVDDMMTMRKLVKKSLTELGFTSVVEAPDGQAGWQKIQDAHGMGAPFELVISDWNMPNMMGIDLLKHVRETPALAGTPFVLLTAESEKNQVMEAVKLKVSEYIVKPFTKETLAAKLQNAFNNCNKVAKAA